MSDGTLAGIMMGFICAVCFLLLRYSLHVWLSKLAERLISIAKASYIAYFSDHVLVFLPDDGRI